MGWGCTECIFVIPHVGDVIFQTGFSGNGVDKISASFGSEGCERCGTAVDKKEDALSGVLVDVIWVFKMRHKPHKHTR